MKRYGLIGKNIHYSLSPYIHGEHFQTKQVLSEYNIVEINDISKEIEKLRLLNGFNVTIPYKEAILPYCDVQSQEVRIIKACNTIKVVNHQLHAYNTDVYGFYMLMKQSKLNQLNSPKILIIGAGGAAKAVYYTLTHYLNYEVTLTNRTLEKARQMTDDLLMWHTVSDVLDEFDIVINATNVGVHDYQSPIEIKKIKQGSVFIDLNYQNKLKFLDDSKRLGAKTINGTLMLVYQAAKSYEIWFDDQANIDVLENTLERIK